MLPKSFEYFQNISLPYGDGIGKELGSGIGLHMSPKHPHSNFMRTVYLKNSNFSQIMLNTFFNFMRDLTPALS